MNNQDIFKTLIEKCNQNLLQNNKIINLLKSNGIKESFIFENFKLGFVDDSVYTSIGDNKPILSKLNESGLYKGNKLLFNNVFTIPIYDENKTIINIIFYDFNTQSDNTKFLNDKGILNYGFIKDSQEVIFTKSCLETFQLIQANYHNTTFIYGNDKKYIDFFINNNIKKAIITFEGKASLIYLLEKNNIAINKLDIDYSSLSDNENSNEYLHKLFNKSSDKYNDLKVNITEIENGFIFSFPHITYRIIGNFYEHSISLKVNIKAIKDNDLFINSIDLYKNRERQNFIFNLMDKFGFRDHKKLENDFKKIIEIIENHKEKKLNQKNDDKIIMTDFQKETGLSLLKNPNMLTEIENDITSLGYINEKKNKILTYLIMTSRLMNDPLHAVVVSRTSAGKSKLIDIIESLCPKNDLKSISDLTPQSLYYVQKNELKNKFIVIGEKEGSKGSEYPLRELISKKSITKTVPIKDQVTGIIKTVTIKVNGPM